MHNIYLFQPQYSVNFKGTTSYWLPYSLGCLWAYASQFSDITDNFDLKELIFRRESPDEVVDRMENPDVCGFSCYVWNEQWCLATAKLIKKTWPKCQIIFGGPSAHGGMLKHDYIDTIIGGEGESVFVDVLRHYLAGKPPEAIWDKQRIEVLDHIPSPFLTGVFDNIIKNNPGVAWNMVLETNRGCPYACTFCDWGSLTLSKIKKFPLHKVEAELEWAAKNNVGYIFFGDANFGIFKERDLEIARMIEKASQIPGSAVSGISLQYAKNSTLVVYEIAKIMEKIKVSKGITISMQSMNDATLDAIKRKNLGINNIKELLSVSERTNVTTYTEFIIGLPLETLDTWKKGLTDILELGQHTNIDIWFCQVLVNSELASPESRQKYGIKTIIAKDYYLLDKRDSHDILEEIELINQTNTMSTDDIIEGYMYAWMILHFHIAGYTQLYAKYARNLHDVSYENFYKVLWNKIKTNNKLQEQFNLIKNATKCYLTQGSLSNFDDLKEDVIGHGLHAISYNMFYQHKETIFDLGLEVAEEFVGRCPKNLDIAQRNFLFDSDQNYPIKLNFDYNIYSFEPGKFTYNLDTNINLRDFKISKNKSQIDFYFLRRRGLLKNQFIEV